MMLVSVEIKCAGCEDAGNGKWRIYFPASDYGVATLASLDNALDGCGTSREAKRRIFRIVRKDAIVNLFRRAMGRVRFE